MSERVDLVPDPEQFKPVDLTPDEVDAALWYALDGKVDAERILIQYFHERMAANQPYDRRALEQYLKEVFSQVLDRTANKAGADLLLRRSRGRPETEGKYDRDLCLAAAVLLRIRQGLRKEAACFDVAEDYGVFDRQVQRAVDAHKKALADLVDPELKALADGFEK